MKTWLHALLQWSVEIDHRKGSSSYWTFSPYSVNSNGFCTDVCKHYLALVGGLDHDVRMRRRVLTTQLRILPWRQKYRPLASDMLTHQPFTLTLSRNHGQSSVWTWLLILQYLLEAGSASYSDSWAGFKNYSFLECLTCSASPVGLRRTSRHGCANLQVLMQQM